MTGSIGRCETARTARAREALLHAQGLVCSPSLPARALGGNGSCDTPICRSVHGLALGRGRSRQPRQQTAARKRGKPPGVRAGTPAVRAGTSRSALRAAGRRADRPASTLVVELATGGRACALDQPDIKSTSNRRGAADQNRSTQGFCHRCAGYLPMPASAVGAGLARGYRCFAAKRGTYGCGLLGQEWRV